MMFGPMHFAMSIERLIGFGKCVPRSVYIHTQTSCTRVEFGNVVLTSFCLRRRSFLIERDSKIRGEGSHASFHASVMGRNEHPEHQENQEVPTWPYRSILFSKVHLSAYTNNVVIAITTSGRIGDVQPITFSSVIDRISSCSGATHLSASYRDCLMRFLTYNMALNRINDI